MLLATQQPRQYVISCVEISEHRIHTKGKDRRYDLGVYKYHRNETDTRHKQEDKGVQQSDIMAVL